ncbi:MAG: helix-turn-helix domain-containing protein [Chloroflexota bacterium]
MFPETLGAASKSRSRIEREGADRARWLRSHIARDVRQAREDSGMSQRKLAIAAGISPSTAQALERARFDPSTEVLARIATVLGMSLSVRLYPGTGPLVRDHIQAAMPTALLDVLDERRKPTSEVVVNQPVRGVIDLTLEVETPSTRAPEQPAKSGSSEKTTPRTGPPVIVTCEAHSEMRRLERQIRWASAKSLALARHAPGTLRACCCCAPLAEHAA